MRRILDFIVYGNILIGAGAYSLCSFSISTLQIEALYPIANFVGFATIFTYNFHRRMDYSVRLKDVEVEPNSASLQWMIQNPILSKITSLSSFLLAIYFMAQLPSKSLWIILPISLISLLYVQSLSDNRTLREIPFLKLFLIALVWTAATVGLPLLFSERITLESYSLPLLIFLFMLSEIIPFDLRDLESDQEMKLKTVASWLGWDQSKYLTYLLLVTANLIAFFSLPIHLALAFFISSIYMLILILLSKRDSKDYLYSLFIEFSLTLPWISLKLIDWYS